MYERDTTWATSHFVHDWRTSGTRLSKQSHERLLGIHMLPMLLADKIVAQHKGVGQHANGLNLLKSAESIAEGGGGGHERDNIGRILFNLTLWC